MPRLTLLTLGTVAGLLLATPAAGAAISPKTLPAIAKTLDGEAARAPARRRPTARRRPASSTCACAAAATGTSCCATSRAARSARRARSAVARSCRPRCAPASASRRRAVARAAPARRARTTFRLTTAALPKLAGALQLLRVQGNHEADPARSRPPASTSRRRAGSAGPTSSSPARRTSRRSSPPGCATRVRVADLAKSFSARARGRPPLRDARRRGRLAAADGPHDVPHLRGRPGRAQGPRRRQPRPRAQGRLRDLLPGPRDLRRRDRQERRTTHDGRPVFFLMALHHAREWPSMEAAMEFAHLLVGQQGDSRIASLLAKERVVILPLVNPDGFISSRNAFDLGDQLGQNADVTLVEAIAPFGGQFAYRRKNCDGEILPPSMPCELAWGVDPNRNYGYNWGGSGSSADVTSQSYHGPGPRSEPEDEGRLELRPHARGHDAHHAAQRRGARPAPARHERRGPRARRAEAQGDRRPDGHRGRLHVAVRLPALRHERHDRGRLLRGDGRLRLHDRDRPAGRQLPHALPDGRRRRVDRRERAFEQPGRPEGGAPHRRRRRRRPGQPRDPRAAPRPRARSCGCTRRSRRRRARGAPRASSRCSTSGSRRSA